MDVLNKNQNTPRPSGHPPVMGSKVAFMYRSDVDVILGNCTKLFVTKDQPRQLVIDLLVELASNITKEVLSPVMTRPTWR